MMKPEMTDEMCETVNAAIRIIVEQCTTYSDCKHCPFNIGMGCLFALSPHTWKEMDIQEKRKCQNSILTL